MIPIATYITWQALSGTASTIEDLRKDLGSLPKLQILNACAVINTVLKTWQGNIDLDEHEQLLRIFFSREFADKLNSIARTSTSPRFVFHRQQLLFLTREAIVHSPDVPDLGKEFEALFAKCCLRSNDLLHHGLAMQPEMSRVERLLPEFVTITDYSYRESIRRKTARTRILLEEILDDPSIKGRPEFVDLPTLFADATSLTIREYSNLVFGTLTKYLKLTLAQYVKRRETFVFSRKYFQNTRLAGDKIGKFLQDISTTTEKLHEASRKSKHLNDFTALRDHPLLMVQEDSYFPLDIGFLADKLETGVFWRVHSLLGSKKQQDRLHTFWGLLFHQYTSQLLQKVCKDSPNRFLPSPKFGDDGEACDGVILAGANAIFMEYKGSMLTAEAKYSGSSESLMADLGRKFIGTDDAPKGVRQLAKSIVKYADKKNPRPIQGIGTVSKIFPLIVARENVIGSPLVNRYLNEQFQALYNRKKIGAIVTPLFVLTIDELEQISPHLSYVRFDEILKAKYKDDPKQTWPFSAVPNQVLKNEPQRVNEELEQKFRRVVDQACRDFFGKPYDEVHPE